MAAGGSSGVAGDPGGGEHLDTTAVHARRRTGGAGTAGYDPDMLVTLLVWAYAHGVTSSRRIEAAVPHGCGVPGDLRGGRAGSRDDRPVPGGFPDAGAGAVHQVLMLCARLGMGKLGVVALDGMKIAATASKAANRTEDTLGQLAAQRAGRARRGGRGRG